MGVEQSGAETSPGSARSAPAARPGDDTPSSVPERGTPASSARAAGPGSATNPARAAEQDSAETEFDELKRKFREALDRKRVGHASANAEGAQDTGKVHGSHGPATSRRSFRRKSGS
jgi:Family of unknown function (DUF5302)